MDQEHSFHLVNGRFEPDAAQELFASLIEVKSHFHRSRISQEELLEEDVKASEKRILALEQNLREIQEMIRLARESGSRLDLETLVTIKTVQSSI
jgi:hypothetical protein